MSFAMAPTRTHWHSRSGDKKGGRGKVTGHRTICGKYNECYTKAGSNYINGGYGRGCPSFVLLLARHSSEKEEKLLAYARLAVMANYTASPIGPCVHTSHHATHRRSSPNPSKNRMTRHTSPQSLPSPRLTRTTPNSRPT